MPHRCMRLQTNRRCLGMALILGLVLGIGLAGCSRSGPLSLPPDQIQTLHQDDVFYMWAYSDCPTSPPPAVRSAGTNQALVGEESWPSGGKAGFECATATRIYIAGVRFPLRGLDSGGIAHAQLALRLDRLGQPLTQPPDCTIEVSVAEQDWAQADLSQTAADPYAVLSPGKGSAIGVGSAHAVTYDSSTQTVTVDVTAAVGDWIAQRHPNQGFLFKSFNGCRLTRLSSLALILSQG
jgi:predicted small lipoprotein YifL